MPTESKKKKSNKDEKKVSLIAVKKEPIDIKSLEHYVDDRIELIRQIFDSLKTKTIESIIPEFLQDKPIEEIQEICLEEVLGISKKRLLSIINATKCPTDTESSDSGSDVEKVEEHISLEEISSDSNDELSKPKKKKRREIKKEPASSKQKPKPKEKPAEQNGENPEKQYSVLELLELQARARAIRSQLALEPVTKIELDDSDTEPTIEEKEKEKESSAKKAAKPSQSNGSPKQKQQPTQLEDQTNKVPASRPVRLKRNFRQRQMEGYESDENQATNEKESTETDATDSQAPTKQVEKDKTPEKEKSPLKQPDAVNDDDVVPVIAEPEVLCISSSDSENEEKMSQSKVKKYITMPVVEKVARPPTEDELFLLKIKEKSEAKLKSDSIAAKEARSTDAKSDSHGSDAPNKTNDPEDQADDIEMEDGEIIEEDEIVEIAESPEPPIEASNDEPNKEETAAEHENVAETFAKPTEDENKSNNESGSSDSESNSENQSNASDESGSESDNSESKAKSQTSVTSKKSNVDDDDEDIIDLGKDEDLDFEQLEMSTSLDEQKKDESPRRTRSKTKSHQSDDRKSPSEPKDESWDKRWLRGTKVSKVLATAKLANKVRTKIKEKKTKTITPQKSEEVDEPKAPTPIISASVEVGSVEHYKKLTKQKST